jgi:hypothetical protein
MEFGVIDYLKKPQILFNKNNWSLYVMDEKPSHPCIRLWTNKFNGAFHNLDTWIEVVFFMFGSLKQGELLWF